jgi:hypothetical protein
MCDLTRVQLHEVTSRYKQLVSPLRIIQQEPPLEAWRAGEPSAVGSAVHLVRSLRPVPHLKTAADVAVDRVQDDG